MISSKPFLLLLKTTSVSLKLHDYPVEMPLQFFRLFYERTLGLLLSSNIYILLKTGVSPQLQTVNYFNEVLILCLLHPIPNLGLDPLF